MPQKRVEDYFASLSRLKPRVYFLGQRVENVLKYPIIGSSTNLIAKTYELVHDPLHRELITARSNITGEIVTRFTHLYQGIDDLIKKVKMLRLLGEKTGSWFQRCVGVDPINSVDSVTYEMG